MEISCIVLGVYLHSFVRLPRQISCLRYAVEIVMRRLAAEVSWIHHQATLQPDPPTRMGLDSTFRVNL